jgi:putative endonuclease
VAGAGVRHKGVAPGPTTSFEAALHQGKAYVYLLRSLKDGNAYLGWTTNLKRRLDEHHEGLVASTKGRRPLELVSFEMYASAEQAKTRERSLKRNPNMYRTDPDTHGEIPGNSGGQAVRGEPVEPRTARSRSLRPSTSSGRTEGKSLDSRWGKGIASSYFKKRHGAHRPYHLQVVG